jgi:hypothetical protein
MTPTLLSFGLGIGGVVVGGLITWGVSWHFYRKAGDELRAEAERLRRLSELVLYVQLHPDAQIEAKRDEKGHVTGLIVSAVGTL